MKKNLTFLVIVVLSSVFLSCGLSDAEILGIDFIGATQIGTTDIDSEAKTVAVTVEPVDLSNVTPTLTVSSGATFTLEKLQDGTAVACKVVAENGSETDWTVTVTVTPGVFFTYGTSDVVLMEGIVNSSDSSDNVASGNGVPVGGYVTGAYRSTTKYFVMEKEYDKATESGEPATAIFGMEVEGKTVGDMSNTYTLLSYISGTASTPHLQIVLGTAYNSYSLYITEYGDVSGYIIGTFSCPQALCSIDGATSVNVVVTNGFFKVKRVPDDVLSLN